MAHPHTEIPKVPLGYFGPFYIHTNDGRLPCPFICLKPEKDTPFGQSFPIQAIIGSIPPLDVFQEDTPFFLPTQEDKSRRGSRINTD